MIDAKEIRVGNWIRSIHTGNVQVSLFMLGEIADDETYLDHLMPIPLSPSVLIACGFRKHESKNRFEHDDLPEDIIYGNGFYMAYVMPEIKSLHQLQNLFFALTQTELNYKPLK